ncbi:CotH kinase family protein [Candidatus Woesearchaeota archaeon]|nr:CotH kinase family protein [Candidatus Woesearchaeota archaeon]
MQIKDRETMSLRDRLSVLLRLFASKKTLTVFVLALFVFGLFLGMLFAGFFGTLDNPSPTAREFVRDVGLFSVMQWVSDGLKIVVHPISYFQGLLTRPEKIILDIPFENYELLRAKREQALQDGSMVSTDEDFISAKLRYANTNYKIDLRLKGDKSDHWIDDKYWSFRVNLDGENTLLGMRKFSLQRPLTRGYLNEWYLHKLLKYSGLISLRYHFIHLIVNGNDYGIYALEEHFDKRLIEYNNRREGPVFRFDDALCWYKDNIINNCEEAYTTSAIEPFELGNLQDTPELFAAFIKGKDLLEAFRQGQLSTSEVFDVPKLAKLFALGDLLGYHHMLAYTNMRFYYNTVTGLLEPIGFDNSNIELLSLTNPLIGSGRGTSSSPPETLTPWIDLFFQDEEFYRAYLQALAEVSQPSFVDTFFTSVADEAEDQLRILHKTYPWYTFDKEQIIRTNREYISVYLEPLQGVQAYVSSLEDSQSTLVLELGNIHPLPLEIVDVTFNDEILIPERSVVLESKRPFEAVRFVSASFSSPSSTSLDTTTPPVIVLRYRLLGLTPIYTTLVHDWPALSTAVLSDPLRDAAPLSEFSFLDVDASTKRISIPSGSWTLSDLLVIPKGYTVSVEPGTKIDLVEDALIVSYSPLALRGTPQNKIELFSSDGTGQGVLLLFAKQPSTFSYVSFSNLREPDTFRNTLTAVLTTYETSLSLDYVSFTDIHAEDAFNAVRSTFSLQHASFENTLSDCFDSDFSTGSINFSRFVSCGNDGFDLSGSIVSASDIVVLNAGDKGISSGEMSTVTGERIQVDGANIGAASKDKSLLTLKDSTLLHTNYTLAVYQKKPEFGPAKLIFNGLEQTTFHNIIEQGSQITLNGKVIAGDAKNVYEVLYGQ